MVLVQVLQFQPGLEVRNEAGPGKGKGVFTQKVKTPKDQLLASWQRLIALCCTGVPEAPTYIE